MALLSTEAEQFGLGVSTRKFSRYCQIIKVLHNVILARNVKEVYMPRFSLSLQRGVENLSVGI